MAIRRPTIPSEVVVHLGAPDEAAKNITVPFVEYIKNVASSEIYPNWPLDAIKANVLAQISFALNRIYNEWYRSQGYNFDITSDPVYDQLFIEDRQFFESVSKIVDDLFNNYIVRDDQVQPLFAQYCDGRITTCDGLSQWGTVALAAQGKSPIEILRYYYGDDIKLVYNAPVEANIISYPGFPLRLGSSGNDVKIIKTQLNRISKNYPAIPSIINESHVFTLETENAVKKFQEIFDLESNGIVDKATWYKIKYIYNAVKEVANLYSEGISMDEVMLLFNTQFAYGDVSPYIRDVNYYLNVISFFDSDIPFLNLSSEEFTKDTEQVVMAFQNKYNIPATGIVDANTWKYIIENYDQILKTIPTEYMTYINEFYPGIVLSKDMSGSDIVRLQEFLLEICKNTHSIPGVIVNGIFDNLTEQSVKTIQMRYNLPSNGYVDAPTWYRIVELSKENS